MAQTRWVRVGQEGRSANKWSFSIFAGRHYSGSSEWEGVCVRACMYRLITVNDDPHTDILALTSERVCDQQRVDGADVRLSWPVSRLRMAPTQPDEGRQISSLPGSLPPPQQQHTLPRFTGPASSLAPQSRVMVRQITWSDSACSSAEGHLDRTLKVGGLLLIPAHLCFYPTNF